MIIFTLKEKLSSASFLVSKSSLFKPNLVIMVNMRMPIFETVFSLITECVIRWHYFLKANYFYYINFKINHYLFDFFNFKICLECRPPKILQNRILKIWVLIRLLNIFSSFNNSLVHRMQPTNYKCYTDKGHQFIQILNKFRCLHLNLWCNSRLYPRLHHLRKYLQAWILKRWN